MTNQQTVADGNAPPRSSARLWMGIIFASALACSGGGGTKVGDASGADSSVAGGPDSSVAGTPLVISTATPAPRTATWAVNYWQWMPSYGDGVTGTDALVAALKPAFMRVGGYNNDANVPDVFDNAAFDHAIAYARAIGAEPIIQVPHLADAQGETPTPDTAAAMVAYANVAMGYGVKYFSVGNEPDIYDAQGLPSNSAQPAIPGYTPTAFCASATAFVAAMKAVDPTIQIVGPDLAWKYQAGYTSNDWLTPVLSTCGDLFDVIAIHRYPFEAKQAKLSGAAADAAAFRNVIAGVRGILATTGQASKPLALTEMNVAYNATTCVLDASPGTVGSALWLADAVGTALELGLWTTAVWDISDVDDWSLGLIGMPPAHTPRPPYYTYQLYAEHFGPTLVNVTSAPAGVSAHASRDPATNTTQVIAMNWNNSPTAVEFQIDGATPQPPSTTFVLPAVSIAAVEIPDQGAATAWIYGEAQRRAAVGPQALAPGGTGADIGGDSGTGGAGKTVGTGCPTDGGFVCPGVTPPSPVITTMGTTNGTSMSFGSGSYTWGSYTYAASGQPQPMATVTSDGNGIQITATFIGPIDPNNNYAGVGLYYNSSSCLNVTAYTGVEFDLSGDLGGCSLAFGATASNDITPGEDSQRGGCAGTNSTCYGSSAPVTPSGTTIKVPFASLSGGRPNPTLDQTMLVNVQWQLSGSTGHTDGGGCVANFTVSNVSFY